MVMVCLSAIIERKQTRARGYRASPDKQWQRTVIDRVTRHMRRHAPLNSRCGRRSTNKVNGGDGMGHCALAALWIALCGYRRRAVKATRMFIVAAVGTSVISANVLAQKSQGDGGAITHPRDVPREVWELFTEPLTRSDRSPQWQAFMRLHGHLHAEDEVPGLGIDLTIQHGLSKDGAHTLLEALRDVVTEFDITEPHARAICKATISSSEEYVRWWAHFDEEVKAHRQRMVDALVSKVDASLWDPVFEEEYVLWLTQGVQGKKINRQKQVETTDYRIWIRGMCG
jgi:hypothetical protein